MKFLLCLAFVAAASASGLYPAPIAAPLTTTYSTSTSIHAPIAPAFPAAYPAYQAYPAYASRAVAPIAYTGNYGYGYEHGAYPAYPAYPTYGPAYAAGLLKKK